MHRVSPFEYYIECRDVQYDEELLLEKGSDQIHICLKLIQA